MPTFVTQGRLTGGYVQSGLTRPEDRQAALSKVCEEAGGRLIMLLFTLGEYDFLLISEMPDAMAAAAVALAATGGGGMQGSVTIQAFTTAEAKELFSKAGKISYKPMGSF